MSETSGTGGRPAASAPPESVVLVEQVSFAWQGTPVLEDCTLAVDRGHFLGLLGPNGGGKTTLLRLILGEMPPARGQVLVFGEPAHRLGAGRRRLGYVPQRERSELLFPATALDAVLMGTFASLGWGRRPGRRQHEQALAALDRLGIADLAAQHLRELSGGQQQRVFVARALAGSPELLLLDEPTVGMDVSAIESFFVRLRDLQETQGLTIIMATHDLEHIRSVADRLACIGGRIHWHGRTEALSGADLEAACELDAFHRHVRAYHSEDHQDPPSADHYG